MGRHGSTSYVCRTAMKRILAAIAIVVATMTGTMDAWACGGALLEDSKAIAKLIEAEEALEAGDVLHARALAAEVERDADLSVVRTARIRALSFVRDRNASHESIEEAAKELGEL